ncbi:MAG TPA: hypothetical protein VMF65_21870 [Acidimicrobiales bacterium]|nr:hypothetical protein [Acidimicrobiales bacterium]
MSAFDRNWCPESLEYAATERETFEAYAADALVALLHGRGQGQPTPADIVYVVDLAAARRGHSHSGEVCQDLGTGPVPVSEVAQLAEDAFIKAVLYEGTRIHTVAHFGRHIKAELRTALELGPAPASAGAQCAETSCGRR